MKTYCRLTALAFALSSLYFFISGFDALDRETREMEALLGPKSHIEILSWELSKLAPPLLAGLAHVLLSSSLLYLPDSLNPLPERLSTLGIQGKPLE